MYTLLAQCSASNKARDRNTDPDPHWLEGPRIGWVDPNPRKPKLVMIKSEKLRSCRKVCNSGLLFRPHM